jgi:hypothetical protein
MAVQGAIKLKSFDLPSAFIQIWALDGHAWQWQGMGRIYADRSQAELDFENSLEEFVVITTFRQGVDSSPLDKLYQEILAQPRFKDCQLVEDVAQLLKPGSKSFREIVLGEPSGYAYSDPEESLLVPEIPNFTEPQQLPQDQVFQAPTQGLKPEEDPNFRHPPEEF